jgi:hypothetical protein
MTVREKALSWALALVLGFGLLSAVGSFWLLPRLNAGVAAANYLDLCVRAKVCPTVDFLQEKLQPAPAHPVAAPPTPPPAAKK